MNMSLQPLDQRFVEEMMPLVQDSMRLPWQEFSIYARYWIVLYAGTQLKTGWGSEPLSKERGVVSMAKMASHFQDTDRDLLNQYQWIDLASIQDSFQRVNIMQSWTLHDHFSVSYTIVRSHMFRRILLKKQSVISLVAAISHQRDMLRKYGPTKRCRICNSKMVKRCFVCSHRELEDEGNTTTTKKTKPTSLKEVIEDSERSGYMTSSFDLGMSEDFQRVAERIRRRTTE